MISRESTDNPVVSFSVHRDGDASVPPPKTQARYSSFGLETLLELFEHDAEAIRQLLSAALAAIEADTRIIEASAPSDRYAIGEAAHRVKGTSGSIGAGRIIEISSHIEDLVARDAGAIEEPVLRELRSAVAAVRADIADCTRSLRA